MHNFLTKVLNFFEDYGMKRAHEHLRTNLAYRKTYDELSRLSDKELRDIGISRGMIHSIALESILNSHKKNRVAPQ